MAKKKFNKKKALKSTFLWTVIYFTLIIYYVYHSTNINLLKISDWKYKYDGFLAGQWAMTTTDTLLLLIGIILFIPVWILGSMMLYKINWSFPKFTKAHEKNFKNKLIVKQQDGSNTRLKMPIKLKIQPSALSAYTTQSGISSTTRDNISDTTDLLLNSVEKDSKSIEMIATQILERLKKYQVEAFLNLNLDGIQIPLAVSSEDETAYLITIINEPNSFLTVDFNNDIDADWFSTLGPLPSPAKLIRQASEKLKELEKEAKVFPIIVLAGGELNDCEQVAKVLNQNDIILTRFDQGKPEELETIEAFLDKILLLKNENAPLQNDTVN